MGKVIKGLATTILLIQIIFLSGCATVGSMSRPMNYQAPIPDENLTTNLLSGMSAPTDVDQSIRQLLNAKVRLPKLNRIAIVKLNSSQINEGFIELNSDTFQTFISPLRESPHIYDAAYLPTLLMPVNKDMIELRKASALFQADLLLVYRSQCRSFNDYKIFANNHTKAYCDLESLLIDVRSGLVVATAVSRKHWIAEELKDDVDFYETILKAQSHTINLALKDIAELTVARVSQLVMP